MIFNQYYIAGEETVSEAFPSVRDFRDDQLLLVQGPFEKYIHSIFGQFDSMSLADTLFIHSKW